MAAPKNGPEIGFATGTYGMKRMATGDALRTLAKIGYDGVELCLIASWPADPAKLSAADRRELRKLIGDTGLALPAVLESLPYGSTPSKRTHNIERLKALDLANELAPANPPVIDTILGRKSADWDKIKGTLVDEVGAWTRVANATRTAVCFKPHAGQAVDTPNGRTGCCNRASSMSTAISTWKGCYWN
jgi:sugar phosphate isomerase/epimerase